MAAEPERESALSKTAPNPMGARIGALIFLVFAFIALSLTALGVTGLILSIAHDDVPRTGGDWLILTLGGSFFSTVFLMIIREFRAMAKRDRRARQLAAGRCPRCGYDIRHLPEPRCPECGETWEPPPS